MVPDIVAAVVELHDRLDRADVPHAFGGALALAWCTRQARGTIDIDLNIFVPAEGAAAALAVLPDGVAITEANRSEIQHDGQSRLWWGAIPVDVFFDTTEFHVAAGQRTRREQFAGRSVPFLSCTDVAVFKAFFDRPKDWVDLHEMVQVGSVDVDHALGVLVRYLGGDDHRVERLRALAGGADPLGLGSASPS
jgi:hypothetical protein